LGKNRSAFHSPNRFLSLALGSSFVFQLLVNVIPGLRRFLGIERLGFLDFIVIGGNGVLSLSVNETTKEVVSSKPEPFESRSPMQFGTNHPTARESGYGGRPDRRKGGS
jgi:hypothetical protein